MRLIIALLLLWAVPTPQLTIVSPVSYQVIQRENGAASIWVSGYVSNMPSFTVEYSIDGQTWNHLTTSNSPLFAAVIPGVPAGQYTVSIRAAGVTKEIPFVGIGDLFVIAGQSNASGRIIRPQSYNHPTLQSGLFGNDYRWKKNADFTDSQVNQRDRVSAGDYGTGSIWPLLATLFLNDQSVPIGFIPCAKGGSSIIQWIPDHPLATDSLYGSCINRVGFTGGKIKAVIWIQGESDAGGFMSSILYRDYLNQIADSFQNDIGAPLVVNQLHVMTSPAIPLDAQLQIRRGIFEADAMNANIITGADLSVIRADDSKGQHFTSVQSAQLAAELIWNALKTAFY